MKIRCIPLATNNSFSLTKLEYFAGLAMQGMLATYSGDSTKYLSDIENEAVPTCNDAVSWAKKLIEALNKQP